MNGLRGRDEGGVTIVELLVVMLLLGVVAAASVQVVMTMVRAEVVSTDLRDRMDRSRLALQRIREDTRFAREICGGSTDRRLEVYSELPDGSIEHMRYEMVTSDGEAALQFTNVGTGATGTLADGFADAPVFTYVGTPPAEQPSTLACGTPAAADDAQPLTDGVQIALTMLATGQDVVDQRTIDTEIQIRNANLDRTITNFNPQPVARFNWSCTELTCEFDAGTSSDDGEILSYRWDFGDGSEVEIQTGPGITHTFPSEGVFDVTLTVEDDHGGMGSTTDSVDTTIVDVGDGDPAVPEAVIDHECEGLTCTFDGRRSTDSDGSVVGWSWGFGDGNGVGGLDSDPVPYTYATPGIYTVELVVTDDDGNESVAAKTQVDLTSSGTPRLSVRAVSGSGSNSHPWWTASVTWEVETSVPGYLSGALLRADQSGGGTPQCTVQSDGTCTMTVPSIHKNSSPVTFTVASITLSGAEYDPDSNDVQSITVCRGACS